MHVSHTIGQAVTLHTSIKDATAGIALDPSQLTLTIQSPTGNKQTVDLSGLNKDDVGQYHYDLTLTEVGKWAYRWAGTGQATGAAEGVIQVNKSVIKGQ